MSEPFNWMFTNDHHSSFCYLLLFLMILSILWGRLFLIISFSLYYYINITFLLCNIHALSQTYIHVHEVHAHDTQCRYISVHFFAQLLHVKQCSFTKKWFVRKMERYYNLHAYNMHEYLSHKKIDFIVYINSFKNYCYS